MTPDGLYLAHVDQPCGKQFAATVGRLQEGFLRDGVCDDLDDAIALLWDYLPCIGTPHHRSHHR